jgi:glycine cleavage system H protein
MYPADRKYTRNFEWVKIVGSDALVGVTEYALEVLGDPEAIVLPKVGRSLNPNEPFGSLEATKALVELTAPMRGEVVEVNAQLRGNPKRLVSDPYGTWVIRMTLKDPAEFAKLLSHTEVAAREQRKRNARNRPVKNTSAPSRPKPVQSPKAPAPQQPRPPDPQPQQTLEQRRAMALSLQWSLQLRDHRLSGGDDAFGDRDYSGGSGFSWREREIVFTTTYVPGAGADRRYAWRDTRRLRVSTALISQTTATHTDYQGTWAIEVIGAAPYLVLQDRERGRLRYRLEEDARGRVLLDGRPYTVGRI